MTGKHEYATNELRYHVALFRDYAGNNAGCKPPALQQLWLVTNAGLLTYEWRDVQTVIENSILKEGQ